MSNTYNPLDMYEIKEQIGAGGGGSVYRCFHKNLQTDVVLKKVHSHITDKSQRRAEVDILKNLHHSYLPTVYDCFEYEGDSYTVMNYISFRSKHNIIWFDISMDNRYFLAMKISNSFA